MATVNESLKGINAYPVPQRTLDSIMTIRGLYGDMEADPGILAGGAYLLARADVLMWLSRAPNITQGGQSYSFSDEDRKQFRLEAGAIYADLEPDGIMTKTRFGYKGNRL